VNVHRPTAPGENQNQHQNQNQNQNEKYGATKDTTLLSSAKRTVSEALQDDWDSIWTRGKHGRYLHSLDVRPDKKALKVHQNLPRAVSSIITQMRTGKIGLRGYLYNINWAETNQCNCNQGEQTVEHILLKCRKWTTERQELWAGGRPILNLRGLLNDPKMSVRAAKMMLKTGLLEQFREVPIPSPHRTTDPTTV
jgi:tubulin alpha